MDHEFWFEELDILAEYFEVLVIIGVSVHFSLDYGGFPVGVEYIQRLDVLDVFELAQVLDAGLTLQQGEDVDAENA